MLAMLFGSRTRARILELLLLDSAQMRLLELQRAVGTSMSSVQAELIRLESLGLVRSRKTADGRYLIGVPGHPLAAEITALLRASRQLEASGPLDFLNPVVRPYVDSIVEAGQRHGVTKLALVGSATQPDAAIQPADLDVLVRFDRDSEGYADNYFGLLEELEAIMGMPVDIIVEDAVRNPVLQREFAESQVVLYEAA